MERYCTECNATLQKAVVDGQETIICKPCSKIEGGYTEEERPLVHELQEHFKDQEWRISGVLSIFRHHLKKETREEAVMADLEKLKEWIEKECAAYQRLRAMARNLGRLGDAARHEDRLRVLQTVREQMEQVHKGES